MAKVLLSRRIVFIDSKDSSLKSLLILVISRERETSILECVFLQSLNRIRVRREWGNPGI